MPYTQKKPNISQTINTNGQTIVSYKWRIRDQTMQNIKNPPQLRTIPNATNRVI